MSKKRVGILFGGCSPEHGVSLQSAYAVIKGFDRDAYDPILIGITKDGQWLRFDGDIEKIAQGSWQEDASCVPAFIPPCRSIQGLFEMDSRKITRLHAVLPLLHGKNGEDGTVQGLLELSGIPVVGCKMLSAALCMDKDKAHKLVSLSGVRTPRSFTLCGTVDETRVFAEAAAIGYPLYVKPVKAGSSFGISRVLHADALHAAIKLALLYDQEVIVEESIPGFEVGCAVFGSDELLVGEVDEIEISGGFFDYKEKYSPQMAAVHLPARISFEKAEEIKETAKRIYRALSCKGFARVDLFLTPSGEIVFNEVNTIPGLTAHSRYPRMLEAIGMPLGEIIRRAVALEIGA